MNTQESKKPLITVIVLTYNRRAKLLRCLESLLHQTFKDFSFEIIVVIDGSTDGTTQILEEMSRKIPALKTIYQSNQGIPAAKNTGLRASQGEFIACVADDFLLPSNFVSSIAEFFCNYPDCWIMRGRII